MRLKCKTQYRIERIMHISSEHANVLEAKAILAYLRIADVVFLHQCARVSFWCSVSLATCSSPVQLKKLHNLNQKSHLSPKAVT
jgi:hypothetical protein